MVLETDSTQLQKLHNNGYLQAIALVGCSLNRMFDKDESDWQFERRNMTHISLCLDTYIRRCDFEADEAAATARVAYALSNFSLLNYAWNDDHASATNAELSVNLFRKLMPAEPPQSLELPMLMAMEQLLGVRITRLELPSRTLLEETLSHQRQLLEASDARLLWTESLMAEELNLEGRQNEALDHYKRCLEEMGKVLGPEHPASVMTVHNVARLYNKMGDKANALKFSNQSVKILLEDLGPNNPATQGALRNLAIFLRESGDAEKELECLDIVARGSETVYGLANRNTIGDLRELYYCYERQGRSDEAEAKAVNEKIIEAEGLSEDYDKMKMQ